MSKISRNVIDMDAIRAAGLKLGVDPLGGVFPALLEADRRTLRSRTSPSSITKSIRRFAFMTVDHDGKIRMDCSSPYAMASLVKLKDDFDIAWGNDPDSDRHGIVTPVGRSDEPEPLPRRGHPVSARHRPQLAARRGVGKTLVSSSMIDRVVADLHRQLLEVPVGFKWFSPGLFDGSCCFGGEESAGASFLRTDGSVWTTIKTA